MIRKCIICLSFIYSGVVFAAAGYNSVLVCDKGDVNGDGYVTKADANYISNCAVGNFNASACADSNVYKAQADVNGDGQIGMLDASKILQLVALPEGQVYTKLAEVTSNTGITRCAFVVH